MLQIVLLAGKFVFLIVLYLFIYRVVRSTTRELRAVATSAVRQRPLVPAGLYPEDGGASVPAAPVRASGYVVWTLVVRKSPSLKVGEAFPFPPGARALVGRSGESDICLEDTFVSSKHALFDAAAEGLRVEDLRSTNGTQVNGALITGALLLQAGDQVEVGDTVFIVEAR